MEFLSTRRWPDKVVCRIEFNELDFIHYNVGLFVKTREMLEILKEKRGGKKLISDKLYALSRIAAAIEETIGEDSRHPIEVYYSEVINEEA